MFLSQLPSDEELSLYYESDSYHFTASPGSTDTLVGRGLALLRRAHLHLSRPLPQSPPGALLDFGCGRGDYLDYARSRGWQAIGVEYSDSSGEEARRRGFEILTEDQIVDLPDASFRRISMIHSLEHQQDPVAIVHLLSTKLTDDGELFIELPYLDSHEGRLFGRHYSMIQAPIHLQFFRDDTIEYLAGLCDLRLVRTRNNFWSPIYYSWSMLNFVEDSTGISLSRRSKNLLSVFAFPITMWMARLASARSRPGSIRQYTLVKT